MKKLMMMAMMAISFALSAQVDTVISQSELYPDYTSKKDFIRGVGAGNHGWSGMWYKAALRIDSLIAAGGGGGGGGSSTLQEMIESSDVGGTAQYLGPVQLYYSYDPGTGQSTDFGLYDNFIDLSVYNIANSSWYSYINMTSEYIEFNVNGASWSPTMTIDETGFTFDDVLKYAADYSAQFTARSIPDKAYVDTKISSSEKGQPGGVVPLSGSGQISSQYLGDVFIKQLTLMSLDDMDTKKSSGLYPTSYPGGVDSLINAPVTFDGGHALLMVFASSPSFLMQRFYDMETGNEYLRALNMAVSGSWTAWRETTQ